MIEKLYETERLILIVPNIKMVSHITDFYIRNKDFLEPFDPVRPESFYLLSTQRKIILKEIDDIKHGRMLKFWLAKKECSKYFIGMLAFNNIIRGAFLSSHLAYKLDKNEIKNGYMTEALNKAISIAFNDLCLHRIEANIMPENKSSMKLASRLGFQNEGTAKKYLKINGEWRDHVHMVLFNDKI